MHLIISQFLVCSSRLQVIAKLNTLFYELTMMRFLYAYGAMLREQASEVMSKDLVQSATLFRKAAGVYHSLATKTISEYDRVSPSDRPPKATSNVCSVMSLVCLAEAQAVTIRKAEEKGNTTSLLAKLHYGIVQMLDEALINLHKANKDRKDISTGFQEFVSACKALHELKSYKHFANSLKADSDSQIGSALGVLQHAQNTTRKSKMPSKESWRSVLKQDLETLSAFRSSTDRLFVDYSEPYDHCHLKTIEPLSHMLPNLGAIATPNAKALLDPLFKNVVYLEPGQSFNMAASNGSQVTVKATAGPVLGPPWQRPENRYLVTSPQGQLTLYLEPHCVYDKTFLEKERADIVITPVIKQLLPSFTLVSGQEDAVQLAKTLCAKFIVPMQNGELDAKGLLAALVQSSGTLESFKELLLRKVPDAFVLNLTPGVALDVSAV